ncbi:hypothetical protein P8452_18432 [Trifolium repens]|nr:hypothetical protein P8452_18432 [Trifolium repens]
MEDSNFQETLFEVLKDSTVIPLIKSDILKCHLCFFSLLEFLLNIPPANVIKEIIQLKYKKLWTSYGKLGENDKLDWFQMFMGKCTWDERDHDIIERNFHIRAAARMSDILRQVRKKFKKKAKKNRASEKGGCIYVGGSISVGELGRRLSKLQEAGNRKL